MESATAVLGDIFVMFLVAKVAGELFERIHQPPVIGELLAGVAIGPYALGWVGMPAPAMVDLFHGDAAEALESIYAVLAELGAIVLLFLVGLETRLSDILRVGVRAGLVAVLGVIAPFVLGAAFVLSLGDPPIEALFLGTAMVATSVGITARVLADLGQIQEREARIILGAAVIDDILGMMVLAVMSSLGTGGGLSLAELGLITGQAVGFTVFVALAGRHAAQRWSIHLERLRIQNAPFVVAVLVMLGMAVLAAKISLAAIIGAFLAGMVFAELREQYELEKQVLPLYEFLVPLFFVITGTHVDWRLFLDGSVLGIALAVTALAIVGKLLGCGLGAWGLGARSVAIIGVGMVPRGEVGLIVANVGKSLGVIPEVLFSTVVVMSVLTTLVVPPVLMVLYRGRGEAVRSQAAIDDAVADGRLPEL
ncbi:MAG TPA: cation:proton antiporter [Chloroflexota bacterium]|jgi:Kef-type K+ transport system membrane component KefB|nr:cation:proton antiporter [Chloroflexota bacterium]